MDRNRANRSTAATSILLVLCLILCVSGCDTGDDKSDTSAAPRDMHSETAQPSDIRKSAERAIERARDAALRDSLWSPDGIWILQQVQKLRPDSLLLRHIESKTRLLEGAPVLRLIDPGAPLTPLPENPGRGIRKLYHYIIAPFGTPQQRAIGFIKDYLASEDSCYVLTHQLLVLVWAEQLDLILPPELLSRKASLVEQIAVENRNDELFSDLFAERTMLLLLHDYPDEDDRERWIRIILEAQDTDGSWGDPGSTLMSYDNQQASANIQRSHVLSLSMLCLALFLDEA